MKRALFNGCHGEFGYFLLHILPRMNGLFEEGYKIDFLGLDEYLFYIQRQCGPFILNSYNIYPWWASDRGGHKASTIPNNVLTFQEHFDKSQYDLVFDFFNMSDIEFCREIREKHKIIKKFVGRNNIYQNSLIFYPRGGKSSWTENRNWTLEQSNQILNHFAAQYKIYVGGVAPETRGTVVHPNVEYLYKDKERVFKTIDVLSSCKAAISNTSGGGVLCMYTGCPSIIFGPDELKSAYNRGKGSRNYLDTEVEYHLMQEDPIPLIEAFLSKDHKRPLITSVIGV